MKNWHRHHFRRDSSIGSYICRDPECTGTNENDEKLAAIAVARATAVVEEYRGSAPPETKRDRAWKFVAPRGVDHE